MTTLGTYQRVVIKGTGVGAEVWQTGVWTVAGTPASTSAQLQTDCTAIAAFVTTWWNAIKASIYSSFALTEVDMYQYVAPATTASLQAQSVLTANAGTQASGGSPIDACCVVSIRSAQPGRSGRNRLYVPFHGIATVATGCYTSTATDAVGTATKALFTSIAGYSTYVPVVVSRKMNSWFQPTAIDTDNKPDVQRRRENKLLPTHTQVLAFP